MIVLIHKSLLLLLSFLCLSISILAQSKVFIGDVASFGQPVDMTQFVEANCLAKIENEIEGAIKLEILHDRDSLEIAQQVAVKLRRSISSSLKLLTGDHSFSIRIYIARVARLPSLYSISNPSDQMFIWPILYDKQSDMNVDCRNLSKLCETIFLTIPHELTHFAHRGKFAANAAWVDEGLAEYVSGMVSADLSPQLAWKREMETLPEISLNSAEIRPGILCWKIDPRTFNDETILHYAAAHQIIRLIVRETEKQATEDPFRKLLAILTRGNRIRDSEEIISSIGQELKVDVVKLGILDGNRKTELFDTAKSTFLRERHNRRTGYKYNSLYTFAYLAEPMSDELMILLYEELSDKNANPLFRRLSARSLLKRLDQPTFERLRRTPALRRLGITKHKNVDELKVFLERWLTSHR